MAAIPPVPAAGAAAVPVPRPDGTAVPPDWPRLSVPLREWLPMALAPFGLVMLAYMLVFGFFSWDSDWARVVVTLLQQLAISVPIVLWVRRTQGSVVPLGLDSSWSARDVGAGIGMGVVAMIASSVVLAVTLGVVEAVLGHPYEPPDSGLGTGGSFWALAAMAVFVAPICEEIYFRGYLFQGLRRWWQLGPAAAASGLTFAFVHVEPIRLLSLWVTGMLFATVFEKRRTLVASMSAHATLNVIAVLLAIATR